MIASSGRGRLAAHGDSRRAVRTNTGTGSRPRQCCQTKVSGSHGPRPADDSPDSLSGLDSRGTWRPSPGPCPGNSRPVKALEVPVPGRLFVQDHAQAALAGLQCHSRLGYPTAFGRPPVQHPAPSGKLDTFVRKVVPTLVPGVLPIEAVKWVGRLRGGKRGWVSKLFRVGLLGLDQH